MANLSTFWQCYKNTFHSSCNFVAYRRINLAVNFRIGNFTQGRRKFGREERTKKWKLTLGIRTYFSEHMTNKYQSSCRLQWRRRICSQMDVVRWHQVKEKAKLSTVWHCSKNTIHSSCNFVAYRHIKPACKIPKRKLHSREKKVRPKKDEQECESTHSEGELIFLSTRQTNTNPLTGCCVSRINWSRIFGRYCKKCVGW